jgi:hypothetical protein
MLSMMRCDEPEHLAADVTYGHRIPRVTGEYPAIRDDYVE